MALDLRLVSLADILRTRLIENLTIEMRILILIIGLFTLTIGNIQAQHEVGLSIGLSTYQGDLAPDNIQGSIGNLHAAFGGFYRYNVNNFIAAKLGINYGRLSADDAESEAVAKQRRNLSFRSTILEAGLTFEWNILGYQAHNYARVFSPYLFAGVAGFKYNPKAFYDNAWVELQPLSTEGQGLSEYPERETYSLIQVSFPAGLGFKYALTDQWNIGIEAGMRFTLTDYIDDVSTTYVSTDELIANRGELAAALSNRTGVDVQSGNQRGNAENNDTYLIGMLFISYNLSDNGLVGGRSKNRRKSGCPTF